MRASANCIAIIKKFEGFSATPYKDMAGVWTIGFGSTIYENGAYVTAKDRPIDETRAAAIMSVRLIDFEHAVNRYVNVMLNQNQFDALVDFCYNLGAKSLLNSTLLVKLNRQDYAGAAIEFMKWVYANGKKQHGLIARRLAERNLFES